LDERPFDPLTLIPPYEREIYVITMIKKKILEKCAAPAAK
jgi:hypothetical protein